MLLSRRSICVNCIPFYYRWQLLSVLPAPAPGPNEGVEGMVAAVASMVAVAAVFVVATAVEAFAVVTEVIEVVTVAGDMDAVTATEAVGGIGLASG